jgi:hypothetical protein
MPLQNRERILLPAVLFARTVAMRQKKLQQPCLRCLQAKSQEQKLATQWPKLHGTTGSVTVRSTQL